MRYQPPGFLRASQKPDVIMMVCTAGHVDHGKTSLVKLLTGCTTDRLKEEIERQLTIELGFAPCYLGDNLCVGIVDVPGHEKFIKNMVAGVSGIEMTILVIAADDGIMPQTIEHLQIMELLGVRKGIVALTKTDLVSKERISELTAEIHDFLKGSFMEDAPIYAVSSETLEGYPEFYAGLVERIKGIAAKRKAGVFRMPIERVFTQKGFGTVVTGIPVDGAIDVGAQVEVVPDNQSGKIRGIQVFLRDASRGSYGQCLALNIPDFNKKPPVRGQVVSLPGYLRASSIFHVRIRAVPGLQAPLRHGEQIKFHTGTIEETGKIYLLEHAALGEGQSGLATIVLSRPVAAAVNDRLIVRRPSPAITVAGGEILAVSYSPHRPQKAAIIQRLKSYLECFDGVDLTSAEGMEKKIEYLLRTERPTGASPEEISRGTLLPIGVVGDCLSRLVGAEKVLELAADYYVHQETYGACLGEIKSRIDRASAEEKVLSLSSGDLRKDLNLPTPLWDRIEEDLERARLIIRRGDKFVLPAAADEFSDAERELAASLLKVYQETGFSSPRPDRLPERFGVPQATIDRVVEHLCNERKIVRLTQNVLLSYDIFKKAEELVVNAIVKNGVLNSADFKYLIESSRKYALAILDFLDARGVTIRINNDRKLAPDYQKHLLEK
jgi:selenocysteine-specific elongation factor